MANLDGTDIYFIHQLGRGPSPLPLILTHEAQGGDIGSGVSIGLARQVPNSVIGMHLN
jgi:hypothetical protein